MKRNVMLVEDNPDDIDLTIKAFRRNNFNDELMVCSTGEEAIKALFEESFDITSPIADHVSLILLDIKLPDMSGMEVLERVRSDDRTRYIPVVMMTSSLDAGDIKRCYDNGANSYVRKSIDFVEFIDALKMIVNYWLRLNESFKPEKESGVK